MAMSSTAQAKTRTPSKDQPAMALMLGGMVSIQLPPVMISISPR